MIIVWKPKLCESCEERAACAVWYQYSDKPGPWVCDECVHICDEECCGITYWFDKDIDGYVIQTLQRMKESKDVEEKHENE